MSEANQCDLCHKLITSLKERLTITPGLWKGTEGIDSEEEFDFCLNCCTKDKVLTLLFESMNKNPITEKNLEKSD